MALVGLGLFPYLKMNSSAGPSTENGGALISFLESSLFLSYHDNAFAVSRALHIVNSLTSGTNATFQLLEHIFNAITMTFMPMTATEGNNSTRSRFQSCAKMPLKVVLSGDIDSSPSAEHLGVQCFPNVQIRELLNCVPLDARLAKFAKDSAALERTRERLKEERFDDI